MTDGHRYDGVPPEVVAKAREAKCSRCGVTVVDESSVQGSTLVSFYVPASGFRARLALCGACGIAFREFVKPELLDDPTFRAAKVELLTRWG